MPSSIWIVGSATLTMLVSRIDMNIPTTSTASAGSHDASAESVEGVTGRGVLAGGATTGTGCAVLVDDGRSATPVAEPRSAGGTSTASAFGRSMTGPLGPAPTCWGTE